MLRSILVALLSLILLALPLHAQFVPEDANWDSRFVSPPVMNGAVHAILVVGDDIYVGGAFTQIEGIPANHVAVWHRQTKMWSALGEGTNGPVYSLAMLGDSLYVGGNFMMIGNESANFIAVYRPSDASWFPLGLGINGFVYTMAVHGDDLYAGGEFEAANDVFARNIARWNGTAKKWYSLGTGAGTRPGDGVHAIVIDGDSLYAGGYFDIAGGNICNHIARYGLNDTTWRRLGSAQSSGIAVQPGAGQAPRVRALAIDGDYLYVGGRFDSAAGTSAHNTARWNISGNAWSEVGTAIGDPSTYSVTALGVVGEELYVGSRDYPATSDARNAPYLMRWHLTGGGWVPVGAGVNDSVLVIAVDNGRLYVGGAFSRGGTVAVNGVAAWDASTSLWSGLHATPGFAPNNTVHAMARLGTDIYVGGDFIVAGDTTVNRIAKFDGTRWTPLGSGLNGRVLAIAVSGTKVYVGGLFTRAGSTDALNVAVWDGTTQQWGTLGNGVNGEVSSIAVDGNNVYIGGSFTVAGSADANKVALWNGTAWSALGTGDENGVTGTVKAVALVDGDLYVGGNIFKAGTVSVDFIARWNRTTSSWSALAEGVGGPVYAIAGRGKELFVGGDFQVAGTTSTRNIARWNIATAEWESLGDGVNSTVYAIGVAGPNLYIAGDFTMSGTVGVGHIALSDGQPASAWKALGSGLTGYAGRDSVAIALAVSGQGAYVGGTMLSAGEKPSVHFGHWTAPPASAPGEAIALSRSLILRDPQPNPSVSTTTISFLQRRAGYVQMRLLSVDGTEVQRPVDGWSPSGEHALRIDLASLPSGTYFCFLRLDDESAVVTMVRE